MESRESDVSGGKDSEDIEREDGGREEGIWTEGIMDVGIMIMTTKIGVKSGESGCMEKEWHTYRDERQQKKLEHESVLSRLEVGEKSVLSPKTGLGMTRQRTEVRILLYQNR